MNKRHVCLDPLVFVGCGHQCTSVKINVYRIFAGNVTIAKGLPAKVMDTADGGADDALDQWVVENFKEMSPEVSVADKDFSKVHQIPSTVAISAVTVSAVTVSAFARHAHSRFYSNVSSMTGMLLLLFLGWLQDAWSGRKVQ